MFPVIQVILFVSLAPTTMIALWGFGNFFNFLFVFSSRENLKLCCFVFCFSFFVRILFLGFNFFLVDKKFTVKIVYLMNKIAYLIFCFFLLLFCWTQNVCLLSILLYFQLHDQNESNNYDGILYFNLVYTIELPYFKCWMKC